MSWQPLEELNAIVTMFTLQSLGIPRERDYIEELPEVQQVGVRMGSDPDTITLYGVSYQRCGGGRRVIRRQRNS